VSLNMPKIEQFDLASQIRRASKSICANVAEGFGKQSYSKAEFKRFIQVSIGSADEMRVWIRYCLDLGYIDEGTWRRWRDEYESIAKMLWGLHSSLTK
jgi:four helix bundle protein